MELITLIRFAAFAAAALLVIGAALLPVAITTLARRRERREIRDAARLAARGAAQRPRHYSTLK